MKPWPLELDVARRFMAGGRSELLRSTTAAALASVALGVAALVVAMALLAGYRDELEEKLVEGNAAVMVHALDPQRASLAAAVPVIEATPGVRQARRVIYGQGTLSNQTGTARAVTLRGVPTAGPAADGLASARVGRELARALAAEPQDVLRLAVLGFERSRPRFTFRSVQIEEVFHTGFAEFDQSWVELDAETVRALVGVSAGELIEIAVDDRAEASRIAEVMRASLGPDYLITDWRELNRALFSALDLQKLALFFLLGLIVVVSTFNVAATLVVLVRERWRDVAVLGALGFARRRIATAFAVVGVGIGLVGGLIGVAAGSLIAWAVTTFRLISFGPEVAAIYFLDAVVLRVELTDLAVILALAVATTALSSIVPSLRAAAIDPAEALRAE